MVNRLRSSFVANFVGQGCSVLLGLAFVPYYLRVLGPEAYGLIGFYLALSGVLLVLDLGLSPTLSREMARYSMEPSRAQEARDLVRTVEVGYWGMGILVGLVVAGFAPLLATYWLKANALPPSVVEKAIVSIGIMSALQWPLTLYVSGLHGLQKQVELNRFVVVTATIRNVGAAVVLWKVSSTIEAFFFWQILVSIVQTPALCALFWRHMPGPTGRRPRIDIELLKKVWRFAAGMSGITVSRLVFTQLDKVILSKLLTLEQFGFYTLAATVGTGIGYVNSPVFNVVFPRLSGLAALGDARAATTLYHRGAQTMTVVIVPTAVTLAFYAYDIMCLWTGNAATARVTAPLVSALAIGTALNGVMVLPYALQLAHGWTALPLLVNVGLVTMMVPAIIMSTGAWGPFGAACVSGLLNGLYLLIAAPPTYLRLLRGEGWRWFLEDVGLPAVGVVVAVGIGRQLMPGPLTQTTTIAAVAASLAVALGIAIATAPHIRSAVSRTIARSSEVVG